jgi:methionine sulfoxide reductase heme-binding subunit
MLALGGGGVAGGIFYILPPEYMAFRLSIASAYVGLALLGASLVIGPWNILQGRPNPVSIDLRRDVGIWAGILGLVHTVVGLQVHMRGRMPLYFLFPPDARTFTRLRYDLFGMANYIGAFATVLLLMLLVLSNNAALRLLGVKRWKSLQRCNYTLIVLVLLHALAYQILERRSLLYMLGVFVATAALGTIRVFGRRASAER